MTRRSVSDKQIIRVYKKTGGDMEAARRELNITMSNLIDALYRNGVIDKKFLKKKER